GRTFHLFDRCNGIMPKPFAKASKKLLPVNSKLETRNSELPRTAHPRRAGMVLATMRGGPLSLGMRVVPVPLNERSYSIMIGKGLLRQLGGECDKLELGRR